MDDQISRRGFVAFTAATVAAGCLACSGLCSGQAALAAEPTGPVDVGPASDFPKDGVYDHFLHSHRLLVIRNEGLIYACTAICTHREAILTVQNQQIVCKRHGSHFSIYGTATKGPARNSLVRYAISLNDQKHLVVDPSKEFSEKDWEKPGASYKLPA